MYVYLYKYIYRYVYMYVYSYIYSYVCIYHLARFGISNVRARLRFKFESTSQRNSDECMCECLLRRVEWIDIRQKAQLKWIVVRKKAHLYKRSLRECAFFGFWFFAEMIHFKKAHLCKSFIEVCVFTDNNQFELWFFADDDSLQELFQVWHDSIISVT